jgi:hypothetical protein
MECEVGERGFVEDDLMRGLIGLVGAMGAGEKRLDGLRSVFGGGGFARAGVGLEWAIAFAFSPEAETPEALQRRH